MSSTAKSTDSAGTGARARRADSGAQLPTLLTVAVLPLLLWRAGSSVAWLREVGESWGPATSALLAETDEELYRRALGAEFPAFRALRDHVPPGARIVLVGGSPESAMFYQHMECMLYPSRLTPVLAEKLTGLVPNLQEAPAVSETTQQHPLYVLAYTPPAELELERWFAGIPWLTRVPVALDSGAPDTAVLLYRLTSQP